MFTQFFAKKLITSGNLNLKKFISKMPSASKNEKLRLDEKNPNYDLANKLLELSDYERTIGGNRFKATAYQKAAYALNECAAKIKNGTDALKIKGIGKGISAKIDEYLAGGKIEKLEEVNKDEHATEVLELTRVPGVGPNAANNLISQGIKTIEDLKKNPSVLTHHQQIGLKYLDDFAKKIPRDEADKIKDRLTNELKKLDDKYHITLCGGYRRGLESLDDIDVLLTHSDYVSKVRSDDEETKSENLKHSLKEIIDHLESNGFIKDTISVGDTRFIGVCQLSESKPCREISIMTVPYNHYYLGVLHLTGSELFNKRMRKHAQDKGYILSQNRFCKLGITGTPGESIEVNSEEEIFDYLEMDFVKPEERNV